MSMGKRRTSHEKQFVALILKDIPYNCADFERADTFRNRMTVTA